LQKSGPSEFVNRLGAIKSYSLQLLGAILGLGFLHSSFENVLDILSSALDIRHFALTTMFNIFSVLLSGWCIWVWREKEIAPLEKRIQLLEGQRDRWLQSELSNRSTSM
jgi:hypothetical protein